MRSLNSLNPAKISTNLIANNKDTIVAIIANIVLYIPACINASTGTFGESIDNGHKVDSRYDSNHNQ